LVDTRGDYARALDHRGNLVCVTRLRDRDRTGLARPTNLFDARGWMIRCRNYFFGAG
jgi:hypothetical protein